MQGWTPDFIPRLTAEPASAGNIDQIIPIAGPDAIRCSLDLARKEGIFVGISGGATFAGALKVAADAPKGSTILAMLPDTGERYLSTPLFGGVAVDMDEEELAISNSTPGFHLGA
jgi:cysteine synthase A